MAIRVHASAAHLRTWTPSWAARQHLNSVAATSSRPRLSMVKAVPGTLVKCDPSIKALILNLDKDFGNRYVIEDLGDEEHLLVKNDQIHELKRRVQEEISKRIETRKDEEEE